jgi:hypothetical protein
VFSLLGSAGVVLSGQSPRVLGLNSAFLQETELSDTQFSRILHSLENVSRHHYKLQYEWRI